MMQSWILDSFLSGGFTFRRCFAEKISFIVLNILDMVFTFTAHNLGLKELNPLMAGMIPALWLFISLKTALPALIAWLVPGKWLWPALALMFFVIGWDVKELLAFLLV